MSDDYFKSESYLRGANNDGMDPSWKPDFKPDILLPIEKIKDLYYAAKYFSDLAEKHKQALESESLRVTASGKKWLELLKAVNAFKETKHEPE